MGYAARARERQWIGLYQLPWWWRWRLLVRWPSMRAWRRIFRGGLWSWLLGLRVMPGWLRVRADHAMIRAAQRAAARATAAARRRSVWR
jgi:hypothetical protein